MTLMTAQRSSHNWRSFYCILFCICLLIGCGGGTRGTGLDAVEGQVVSRDGSPLPDLVVTDVTSGSSDTTTSGGRFVLDKVYLEDHIELHIVGREVDFTSFIYFDDIPERTVKVSVMIGVDCGPHFGSDEPFCSGVLQDIIYTLADGQVIHDNSLMYYPGLNS